MLSWIADIRHSQSGEKETWTQKGKKTSAVGQALSCSFTIMIMQFNISFGFGCLFVFFISNVLECYN